MKIIRLYHAGKLYKNHHFPFSRQRQTTCARFSRGFWKGPNPAQVAKVAAGHACLGLQPADPDKWTLLEGLKIFLHLFLQLCLSLLFPALPLRASLPFPVLSLHVSELIPAPAFPDPDARLEVPQLTQAAGSQSFIPSLVGSQVSIHQPVPRLALSAQPHPGVPQPCHPLTPPGLHRPGQSRAKPSLPPLVKRAAGAVLVDLDSNSL